MGHQGQNITCLVCLGMCVCAGGRGDEYRKKTVEDRGLVPMGHKYAESNGHVIDDVT